MAKWNLDFYQDDSGYSDGESIEAKVLEAARHGLPEDLNPAAPESFPLVYHLSHLRENILNWYPFNPDKTCLEIGAGCGAITGLLCSKLKSVTSVELTKQRASVIYERHKDYDNLEIYVGNFCNMSFPEKFDYIVLNGVFEYAMGLVQQPHPYTALLNMVKELLAPGGILIIAIENRLGLKYFNGAGEDHTGKIFSGLDGYPDNNYVRTFSRSELDKMFNECGYKYSRYYHPYPDYKFPMEIYSDESLEYYSYGHGYLNLNLDRAVLFDEARVAGLLVDEGIARYFTNSFLIEVSQEEIETTPIYYTKLSNDRAPDFRIATKIIRESDKVKVIKEALSFGAKAHIEKMSMVDVPKSSRVSYLQGNVDGSLIEFPFLDIRSFTSHLLEIAKNDGIIGFINAVEDFYEEMFPVTSVESYYNTDAFKRVFGESMLYRPMRCASPANIDLLFDNVFVDNGNYIVIDSEWVMEFKVPVDFILWRSLWALYETQPEIRDVIDINKVYKHFSIDQEKYNCFVEWMHHFTMKYAGTGILIPFQKPVFKIDLDSVLLDEISKTRIYPRLYLDTGDGFSDEHAVIATCNLGADGFFSVTYSLDSPVTPLFLRWDPVEWRCVRVKITSAKANTSLTAVPVGAQFSDEYDLFATEDPHYLLEGDLNGVQNIRIEGYLSFIPSHELVSLCRMNFEYKHFYENSNTLYEETNAKLIQMGNVYNTQTEKLASLIKDYEFRQNEYLEKERVIREKESFLINQQDAYESVWSKNQQCINSLNSALEQKNSQVQLAMNINSEIMGARMFRLVHFWGRVKKQLLLGNLSEKKRFFSWLFGNRAGNDGHFQPLLSVQDVLKNALPIGPELPQQVENLPEFIKPDFSGKVESRSPRYFPSPYCKHDVIMLAVIDYDFRFQRPQHFASSFAQNGHRVFYVNVNFNNPAGVTEINKNLFVVNIPFSTAGFIYDTDLSENKKEMKLVFDELMWSYDIRDAVTIVDYPNWINAADYLREAYGFKIIVDYMDDFTGFMGTTDIRLQNNCINLLKLSDGVAASSQFLYDISSKYNSNTVIIRNGTEFDHFKKASYSNDKIKTRKVVGYYGAVAEWFDAEKVCYIAENLPECDIVIIGHVTKNEELFSSYKNIKLLGEKPYSTLPEYLADFDVCLIPFDTSTDLIKATNPVKFYEYLSAGKKIVATEIPELVPFKDKYVYLANDNEKFLGFVKSCLDGTDILESAQSCMDMGSNHDWDCRYNALEEFTKETVPAASIIVLTYNNLEYNKLCIRSILEKTAYARYELIVVDNCSTDGTREYLQELESKGITNLKIILNDENLGFAAGNNVGMRIAEGDYIVLLNNDTMVTRGWLTSLIKHLENNPDMGMSGAVTNSIGNEGKIMASYNSVESMERFADGYTWKHMGDIYPDPKVLALFCAAVKREAYEKVGLLDEAYGRGMFEDDDYAEAVRRAGYRLCIAEDSFIHHFQSISLNQIPSEEFKRIFDKNKSYFENKWDIKWAMHKYRYGVDWENDGVIELNSNSKD